MRKVSRVSTLPAALLTAQSAESVHRAFWYHHDLGTRSLFGLTASSSEGSAVTTWLHDLAYVGAEGVHVSEDRKQRGREKGKDCSLLLSP